jgi:hypothetical protein
MLVPKRMQGRVSELFFGFSFERRSKPLKAIDLIEHEMILFQVCFDRKYANSKT